MKSLIIILAVMFSMNSFGQDRVSAVAPKISNKINSELKKATGWKLNVEGHWDSRRNRIPVSIESQFKKLIDYEARGLGDDNFSSYQFRDIVIDFDTLVVFIKEFWSGYYTYQSIEKGWNTTSKSDYYVFKKSELEKLSNLKDSSINLVKIETIFSGTLYSSPNTFSGIVSVDIEAIENDILKQKNTQTPKTYEVSLIFHIALYKSKNIVQFQIYSLFGDSSISMIGGIRNEHKIKDPKGKYDFSTKSVYNSEDLFKNCYYETDCVTFSKFIKL